MTEKETEFRQLSQAREDSELAKQVRFILKSQLTRSSPHAVMFLCVCGW